VKRIYTLLVVPVLVMLSAVISRAQSGTPEEALEEMVTTDQYEVVVSHLPVSIGQALDALEPKRKAEVGKELVISKRIEQEGLTVRRADNVGDWQIVKAGKSDPVNIALKNTFISGKDALLLVEVREKQKEEPHTFVVSMRLEEGAWRLTRFGEWDEKSIESEDFLREVVHGEHGGHVSAAPSVLRTLNTALITYCSTYSELGFPAGLATLSGTKDSLAAPDHAMLLDESFLASPLVKYGYEFKYTLVSGGKQCAGSYHITATPVDSRENGTRSFFTDKTGIIRATSENREANERDKPLD
jgi:hypothetical protein